MADQDSSDVEPVDNNLIDRGRLSEREDVSRSRSPPPRQACKGGAKGSNSAAPRPLPRPLPKVPTPVPQHVLKRLQDRQDLRDREPALQRELQDLKRELASVSDRLGRLQQKSDLAGQPAGTVVRPHPPQANNRFWQQTQPWAMGPYQRLPSYPLLVPQPPPWSSQCWTCGHPKPGPQSARGLCVCWWPESSIARR